MSTVPATTTSAIIWRMNLWSEVRGPDRTGTSLASDWRSMSLFGEVTTLSSFEGLAGWCISVPVKKDPGCEGENDHHTGIKERGWTRLLFPNANLGDPMNDECYREPARNADHPGGKVRTEDVDG